MSKTRDNSKRSRNEQRGESGDKNADIEMEKDKAKSEKLLNRNDRREKTATRKNESASDSESESSASSSNLSGSSSSNSTSSKDVKTKEKSKISSRTNDIKNNASLKREKGGDADNRSKWDSPEQRRRSRSPRRERSQGRHEESEKYGKRAGDASRDRYQDTRERRNLHDERKRNDNRGEDRRGYRNRDDERFRKPVDRPRDIDRRDKANDDDGARGSGDKWKNTRNENSERMRGNQRRDRSRSPRRDRRSPKQNERRNRRSRSFEKDYQWGKKNQDEEKKHNKKAEDKEQPNFGLSGALTEDTNKVNGVVVKYAEPQEARRPKRRWRLYPFKGETALPVLHIHRQSCFLVGRDRKVVDLAVDHPSCSKQHAALQYRLVPFKREDGTQGRRVRLYLIDLDSANGTFLNNKPIEARKYYELFEKDVIKFGFSTREYVLLHENSKEDQEDDDVLIKQEQPEGE